MRDCTVLHVNRFLPKRQVEENDGNCPDCGRPVEKVKEESYFFKMSKYADRLITILRGKSRIYSTRISEK